MRQTITIHSIPLWPLVKNVFLISLVVMTISMMILGFFWMGLMREFAFQINDPQMGLGLDAFRNIGGMMVIVVSIINGIFSSFFLTLFTGLAALIYNWINSRRGGLQFDISLPDASVTESTDTNIETHQDINDEFDNPAIE